VLVETLNTAQSINQSTFTTPCICVCRMHKTRSLNKRETRYWQRS